MNRRIEWRVGALKQFNKILRPNLPLLGQFVPKRDATTPNTSVNSICSPATVGISSIVRATVRDTVADELTIVCAGLLLAVNIQKTSSLPLLSSPPTAIAEDGTANISFKPSEQAESPGSPAFSSSSTADGGASPVLPPLPAPTFLGRARELLRTPPSGPRSESSQYYTASWGSPYPQPESASTGPRSRRHDSNLGSEPSEDSPIRHLEFHTPFLRPAPNFVRSHVEPDFVSQDGLISAAVLVNRARRPAQGLTEDWIRQHTGGESTERNNWLSDDPGDSEPSSLSGSLSGDGGDWLGPEVDPITPTLERFFESRERTRAHLVNREHRRQLSAETLKQASFLASSPQRNPMMAALSQDGDSGAEMDTLRPTTVQENPPPLPPKETIWRAAALPSPTLDSHASATISPDEEPQRVKKKVPWKNKHIVVLLPWDVGRKRGGIPWAPMTEKDVASMLSDWERLGYNTAGFNLNHGMAATEIGSEGQSRSVWPPSQQMDLERQQRAFNVSIPDRQEWDNYVRELKEARLRALGVSFGDDDPPPLVSPAPSSMGRQTSIQYPPLPFSPPLPSSSAASSHVTYHPSPFSPALIPVAGLSTSQSSNPGSIASPVSVHGQLQGKYNSRQSVSFTPGDHPFGSPFQYPQQQSPSIWSPQQMANQQGGAGVGSPSLQNLGAIMSPGSPFMQDGYFLQGDALSQLQQRQQLLQLQQQLQQQGSARASPRLQDLREAEDEDAPGPTSKSPSKTPEARYNVSHHPSASLQKEIDDAEYHLEEQFQRELEHEDYSPHSDLGTDTDHATKMLALSSIQNNSSTQGGLGTSRYADDSEGPILHHPQPHSRGHSLSQRHFQDTEDISSANESNPGLIRGSDDINNTIMANNSEIETPPSNLGTPVQDKEFSASDHNRSFSASSNAWTDSKPNNTDGAKRPGHVPKPSFSRLNVAAKEFKFDPTGAFQPSQFAFNGGDFQPPVSAYSAFTPVEPLSTTSSHFSNQSFGSSKGKINVAAPAFTPSNMEFNFSSSGPTFRPDAPAFTPLNSTFSDRSGSINSGSEGPRSSSLFGNIDLSVLGIAKPSKKSKAIPIVRPDSSNSRNLEDDVMDVDGRITQGASRFKRNRAGKDDSDSVPLFAEPSMPLGEVSRQLSPPKETLAAIVTQADKENSAPLDDNEEPTPEIPIKSDSRNILEKSPNSDDSPFAPWQFQQQKQAEDFNAARPFTSKRYGSGGLPAYGFVAPPLDDDKDVREEKPSEVVPKTKDEVPKKHKKNSLSATAKPFEFRPISFTASQGEPFGRNSPPLSPAPRPSAGLSASRYATSPTPPPASPEQPLQPHEIPDFQSALPLPQSPRINAIVHESESADRELTFEEIDDVMRHLNESGLDSSTRRDTGTSRWHQPSPTRHVVVPDPDNSSPIRLLPQNLMRSDAPSPSPKRIQMLPGDTVPQRVFSGANDDPFVVDSQRELPIGSPIHHLNTGNSLPASDWDDVLSETEEGKVQPRARFFDSHVNELVGGLLAARLDPLEKTLETIQMSLEMIAARTPSSRRDRRSVSGALSDADDEDDEEILPRRSLSPKRDKKMEKIKGIVTEALASHQLSRPQTATAGNSDLPDSRNVLQALEEMKEQFGQSMRLDLRGEDLRNIVEEAVERRMPSSPKPNVDEASIAKEAMEAKIAELEDKLRHADSKAENEIKNRRAAEDRLAEVQRLLRISSEEETRLREAADERELKIRQISNESEKKLKNVEDSRAKTTMRIALLEAAQNNAQKSQADLNNRIGVTESDLREARQEAQRWQMETERALEAARRHSEDAEQANETNKDLRRMIERLRTQMEESIRVRDGMRGKLMDLQEDMAKAARDITEDNARRARKEQELVARQEVLDAKLQAEARTRERLEQEIERLETGERAGMRAVSDLKKLEALVSELRTESHNAQKDAMRYQREFEEARESGLSEVQRTRHYMQTEIDSANNQVNVVREDLENQVVRIRAEMEQVKLDADTARERADMLLEEANTSKKILLDDLKHKHGNKIEDLQTQYEQQLNNAIEDARRAEQHLLERLSLSSAKTEHLQDRVSHLEEKLEIAKSAAHAAAKAARSASGSSTQTAPLHKTISRAMELPEKISPQALRESIMVLQDQLQDREQTIEKLEQAVSVVDVDAPTKISKRDDEIMWLRELLAVRQGDLQDIIDTLSSDDYDADTVKDAAIRLRANLQMEEQERQRAMNGGSALNLPNIAASLRDAATPRVAQAVGPLAAAWGSWRKARDSTSSEVPPTGNNSTPSKSSPIGQSFLSGLLTPPASSIRQTPPGGAQPTAFGSTGQRFTSQELANRPRTMTPRRQEKLPMRGSPRSGLPSTPPMMRKSSYDMDAKAEDFGDAGFYDDDESMYSGGASFGR